MNNTNSIDKKCAIINTSVTGDFVYCRDKGMCAVTFLRNSSKNHRIPLEVFQNCGDHNNKKKI